MLPRACTGACPRSASAVTPRWAASIHRSVVKSEDDRGGAAAARGSGAASLRCTAGPRLGESLLVRVTLPGAGRSARSGSRLPVIRSGPPCCRSPFSIPKLLSIMCHEPDSNSMLRRGALMAHSGFRHDSSPLAGDSQACACSQVQRPRVWSSSAPPRESIHDHRDPAASRPGARRAWVSRRWPGTAPGFARAPASRSPRGNRYAGPS